MLTVSWAPGPTISSCSMGRTKMRLVHCHSSQSDIDHILNGWPGTAHPACPSNFPLTKKQNKTSDTRNDTLLEPIWLEVWNKPFINNLETFPSQRLKSSSDFLQRSSTWIAFFNIVNVLIGVVILSSSVLGFLSLYFSHSDLSLSSLGKIVLLVGLDDTSSYLQVIVFQLDTDWIRIEWNWRLNYLHQRKWKSTVA